MNCRDARDKLIDLLYAELPAAEQDDVLRHVESCPECREEWRRLRSARAALAAHRAEAGAGAPPSSTADGADLRPGRRLPGRAGVGRFRRARPMVFWIPIAAGLAAVVLACIGVWLVHERAVPPAFAQEPGIRRVEVSLTILSQPEGWAEPSPAYQQADTFDARQMRVPNFAGPSIPLNAPPYYRGRPLWQGLALVRDQRVVRNLPRGASEVRFTDVPIGILPESVRLRSLDRPDGLTILEQNYQYDLASASAVLRRYVDKPVTIVFTDGKTAGGDLLSYDEAPDERGLYAPGENTSGEALVGYKPNWGSLLIRPPGQGPVNVARDQVQAIRFAERPKGLLSRPTLVWQLQNNAAARQQFEVAYLTRGLSWRADYVLKLHLAKAEPAREEAPPATVAGAGEPAIRNPQPAIMDSADLVGYATIANNSGVTFEDAQLKLLAGDVHIVPPPEERLFGIYDSSGVTGGGKPEGFEEKPFFEYHLYTLMRKATLASAEVKQIELVTGSGLKLRRLYVYDPQQNATAARVVSELDNTEANGLGRPLPKGVVRLYAPDPEGVQTYVAETRIDHTPKDEKVRLEWNYAFDIACSARQTGGGRDGDNVEQAWQYDLRNHKDYGVTIAVVVRVPPSTTTAECNFPWHVRQVGLVEIEVPVQANAAEQVKFSFRYNPRSGGGLKSPHDK